MCGIFGQISAKPAPDDCHGSLHHRGPDDAGLQQFKLPGRLPWVTLAHRRLSIIDLSPCGHQPMCNEDGTVWIAFNGEIYNFQELRSGLIASGHQFQSKTDTETIIHGYEEWGEDVVKHLRGMFAFAIWDARHRRMLLARDRVGKKPLFYYCDGQSLLFASEIKALLATGAIPAELDPVALHDYLTYLYFPPPRTGFKDIFKLPPATCMSVQVLPNGSLERRQWVFWDPVGVSVSASKLSERDAINATRELIDEAVRIRLVSDVPLGVFLSGGIDSSTITAFASRHQEGQVQTFSIGFRDNRSYDELPFAKLVADKFHTDHHVIEADALCAESLTKVVRHFDEPFGNPTAVLEYALTRLMRKYVTVALSGDGADELFGGYERYRGAWLARYYRQLPRFLTRDVLARLSALIRENTEGQHIYRRVREFAEVAWAPEEEAYLRWVGYFTEAEKQDLYTSDFASQVGGYDSGDFLRALFRRGDSLAPMNRLGYVDLMSYLPCNCLEYTDRMSMANSLEVRCPFTDHKLIEFALHLPQSFKVHGLGTKWLLRRAMNGILPPEILNKKKTGFTAPVPYWVTRELKPLITQLLAPEVVQRRGIFRPEPIARLIRDHAENKRDNSYRIWALLMLEIWLRMYFDKQAESTVHDTVVAAARLVA